MAMGPHASDRIQSPFICKTGETKRNRLGRKVKSKVRRVLGDQSLLETLVGEGVHRPIGSVIVLKILQIDCGLA